MIQAMRVDRVYTDNNENWTWKIEFFYKDKNSEARPLTLGAVLDLANHLTELQWSRLQWAMRNCGHIVSCVI